MKSSDIRKRFVEFFAKRGHEVVPSSSLIPKGDPTLLFTNAGMVQFKGVFLKEESRPYKRAVSCQRCMRAGGKHNDLENVGRTARHHTFFEMLGNFSFGDYFKEGAIDYAWEFLTVEMGLPQDKLWVTVFETDDEAAAFWRKKTGLPGERIVRMGAKDNFWSMGDTGPCGPCSEILFDQGKEAGCGRPSCAVGCDCDRYLEIWNLVFMQYDRDADGALKPLPSPCIDTGMGLERLACVMQGKKSNYDTDLFHPLTEFISEISGVGYGANVESDVSMRAITDHARAVAFLMSDGVFPGNVGRDYVLRRIIRRAARHGRFLGIKEPFLWKVNQRVVELMEGVYPEIKASADVITRATKGEEERFFETLERGLTLLDAEVARLKSAGAAVIPGEAAFNLYDTYGFPVDLTADIVKKEGITVDEDGFNKAMDEQRRRARQSWKGAASGGKEGIYKNIHDSGVRSEFIGYHMESSSSRVLCIVKDGRIADKANAGDEVEIITEETPFYGESGGQTGDSGVMSFAGGATVDVIDTKKPFADLTVHHCKITSGSIKLDDTLEMRPDMDKRRAAARCHTATHILHAALRTLVGGHVKQAGSLVSPKGLRFDFSHFEPISNETLKKIEDAANRAVLDNIEVKTDVLSYKEAVARGALAFFGDKYGELVRMVSVPGVSAELCGGTHVTRTGDIGLIRIISETSVASGVRRIEAAAGEPALEALRASDETLKETARMLKIPKTEVPEKIKKLLEDLKAAEREVERLKGKGKAGDADGLLSSVNEIKGVKTIAARVATADAKELRDMADVLRGRLGSGVVVLAGAREDKALLLAAVTKDLTGRISAGEIIKRLAPVMGGKGGGRPDLAQAGGEASKVDDAIKAARKTIEEML